MSTETKHTPWYVRQRDMHDGSDRAKIEIDNGHDSIAAMLASGTPAVDPSDVPIVMANANRIVRAVNAHDALVAAARDAAEIVEHAIQFLRHQKPGREFYPNRESAEATAARLKAAIKLAEEVTR